MDNQDKKIEKLIDSLMAADQLESPSTDFTAKLMAQVNAESKSKALVYEPLISKKVWALLVLIILATSIYFFNFQISLSERFAGLINLDFIKESTLLYDLSNVLASKPILYSIVFLGFFILLQIPILKRHYERGLEG